MIVLYARRQAEQCGAAKSLTDLFGLSAAGFGSTPVSFNSAANVLSSTGLLGRGRPYLD